MTLTATTPIPDELSARRLQRRQREEIEALAARFVQAPAATATAERRPPILAAMLAAAITFVVLFVVLWPSHEAPVARAETPDVAGQLSAWQQQREAERERRRKEMEAGAAYLSRVAATDAELLQDLTARAQALAAREAAVPKKKVAADEPTPKTPFPAPRMEVAQAPAESAAVAPAPAPAAPAVKEAPAAAAPAPVVTASASCSIHVADLSSSGTLTYAAISHMKGARVDQVTGHVFTPPVSANGRRVVFEVMQDGCVRIVHQAGG